MRGRLGDGVGDAAGADVYQTYATTSRGVDRLLFVNSMLDFAVYGRPELREDSPPGWPRS